MSTTTQFDSYHSEIFNFLRTVTIKFEPFSSLIGESLLNNVNPSLDIENNNYYYKRLLGEYIPGDTDIYVNSVDTGEQIVFSKENLKNHPKTATIYKIPNVEYNLLCKRYPDQVDLIKSITYPVESINILKNSPDMCYIRGDTSLLQTTEVASIIQGINNFLTIARNRWWVKEYCFEEGYAVAFYNLVWQLLPLVCFTTRMTNIKTSNAHIYHIWEYLKSKGLEDYRDILSIKQSLFFYRNMDYILANKGTSKNLFILADNILTECNIVLNAKYIYQQQIDKFDECRRTPEIITKQLISTLKNKTPDTITFETIEAINKRMYDKGIEIHNDVDYVTNLEKIYGECEEDRLPTKLLELKKETVSNSYEVLLYQFLLDTLVYLISKNQINYKVSFTDPYYSNKLDISIQDALALWYYFCNMSYGEESIYLPTHGMTRMNYKLDRPAKDTLPKTVYIENFEFAISRFVDVDTLLSEFPTTIYPIKSSIQMEEVLFNQFTTIVKHIRDVRTSCDRGYTLSMLALYHHLCDPGNHAISLSKYTDYESFFNQSEQYLSLKNGYKEINSKTYYDQLCIELFSSFVPIIDNKWKPYVGYTESMEELVEKMTSLCIQLFSHNVTMLGTDRVKNEYLYLTPLAYHPYKVYSTSTAIIDDAYLVNYDSHDSSMTIDTIEQKASYHQQKDCTLVQEEYHTVNRYSIQEYGVVSDISRISTANIKYTFS